MGDIVNRAVRSIEAVYGLEEGELWENQGSRKGIYAEPRKALIWMLYNEVGLTIGKISDRVGVSRPYTNGVVKEVDTPFIEQAKLAYAGMFSNYTPNPFDLELDERVEKLEADMLRVRQNYKYVIEMYRNKSVS